MASNRGFVRKYSSSGEVLWTESNMLDQVNNSRKVATFFGLWNITRVGNKNNRHSGRSGDWGDLRPAGGHGGGHHRHREDTLARQPWPGGRQSSCWCSCCSTWWWTRKSWSHLLHCLFMMVILMIMIMWKIRLLSHCRSCKALSLKLEKSLLVTKAISPSISRWNRNISLPQRAQYFVKFPDPIQSSLSYEGQWAQDWLSVEGSAASKKLRDILGKLE